MLELLRASDLGTAHGFSTRSGGVSQGPYASLNLGSHVGDDPAHVAENRRRLRAASGARTLALLDQVHGDVVRVVEGASGEIVALGSGDAAVTRQPGVALCIGTADCLPILLHAPEAGAVGAAHAGWKGADLRIGARTVEALIRFGADPSRIQAALGPCIRRCCYEVSPELAQRFSRGFGEAVIDRSRERPHLDIALASRIALREAGVPDERIQDLGLCTACDPARFFSHRREQGISGRMLSFVLLPDPDPDLGRKA